MQTPHCLSDPRVSLDSPRRIAGMWHYTSAKTLGPPAELLTLAGSPNLVSCLARQHTWASYVEQWGNYVEGAVLLPFLYRIEQHTTASCSHFRKVFSKLNFHVPEDLVKKIVVNTAGYIEPVLCSLREKIEEKRAGKQLDGTQVSMCEFIIFALFFIMTEWAVI